jgi:hypothetical protein
MPASMTSFSFGLLSSRGRGATWSAIAVASTTIAAASAQEGEEDEDDATKTIVAKSDCWTAGSEKRMTMMIVEVEERWARIEIMILILSRVRDDDGQRERGDGEKLLGSQGCSSRSRK